MILGVVYVYCVRPTSSLFTEGDRKKKVIFTGAQFF